MLRLDPSNPNTRYRVDRAISARTPCGMNSIRCMTGNWSEARRVYEALTPGRDMCEQPNAAYGVILSVWDDTKRDYIIKCRKGI